MPNVYFKPIAADTKSETISQIAAFILERLVVEEQVVLEPFVPLKVHFGEKGNQTFIGPENYRGIIEYLQKNNISSAFIETNVLYRGERDNRTKHLKLAAEHGFIKLPVIIADGEYGEDYELVEINKEYFQKCKIGKEIARQKQLIVLSHFKGHMLAGFGGAVKQLAMGCASRGGKLDQHCNVIPRIKAYKCKSCRACVTHCPENAIVMTKKAKIDRSKCVGCASCTAVCPHNAISNNFLASLSGSFSGRIAEYAYAAAKGKNNIYLTFAMNITRGCDCEGHPMKPFVPNIGIFGSTDPVAIDQACLDLIEQTQKRKMFKKGRFALEHAEKIGLGSREYQLIQL
ncbi:MAG TPA: DUF362 domain-containing protein [Bacillota bacterium]|nr:DUF362 domain-containing protein [Bacillota bacterium]